MPTLTLKVYEWIAGVIALILLCLGLWGWGDWHGHKVVKAQWDAANAKATVAVANAQVKAADVSQKVVTQYVDRVQTVYQKGDTITKRVPIYVSVKDDAACPIPAGFGSLLDASAQGSDLPSSAPAAASSAAPTPKATKR